GSAISSFSNPVRMNHAYNLLNLHSYPAMDNMAWYGLVAPAGVPPEVVKRVHDAAVKALQDPKIRKRLEDGGSIVEGSTPTEYANLIKRELELRKRIATEQKIQLN
ncbi:tripartite tricarboxylate transporter substrate-binding protein, partial [Bordetella pertussis]